MNKRRTFIVVAVIGLLTLAAVYFMFMRKKEIPLMQALPDNVLGFVRINKLSELRKTIDHQVWNDLSSIQAIGELNRDLDLFTGICNTNHDLAVDLTLEQMLAGACITKSKEIDYLMLLDLHEASKLNVAQLAPLANNEPPKISEHLFEKEKIYEFSYANSNLHYAIAKVSGVFIFSTSTVLVENAVLQIREHRPISMDKGFSQVDISDDHDDSYAIFIHMQQLAEYLSMFAGNTYFDQIMQMANYASWLKLHLEITDDGIEINGYASAADDAKKMLLGNYTGEFDASASGMMPSGVAILYQVNTENLSETISEHLKNDQDDLAFFDHWAPWMGTHISIGITESFDHNYQKKYITIIPATDTTLALNKLKPLMITDSAQYRGHAIFEFKSGEILTGITGCAYDPINYAVLIRNNFIFTNELQQLQSVIDVLESAQTLQLDKHYAVVNEQMPEAFNSAAYIHFQRAGQIIKSFLPEENAHTLDSTLAVTEKFPQLEIRFSEASGTYLVHGFIEYRKNQATGTGRIWQTQLEYDIAHGPFTIFNPATGQKNILVQDTAQQLYLLSAGGAFVWKIPGEGEIMGEAHGVDFYGNNKSQILFNTPAGIFLIDLTGEPVEGFPIRLTSPAINPLSVIPGEGDDYNMYIACENNNIYGYSKKGKPLPNWNPMKNAGRSEKIFTPFLSGKNNYLLIQTGNAIVMVDQNSKRIRSFPSDAAIISPIITSSAGNTFSFVNASGFFNTFSADGTLKKSMLVDATITSAGFADVDHDGDPDIVFLDDQGFGAKTSSDTLLFNYRIDVPGTYEVCVSTQTGSDYFGAVSDAFNRTILFHTDGTVAEGFPVDGMVNFVVDRLQGKNDIIFLTASRNMISAYRIE